MRASVRKDDPGYQTNLGNVRIFLHGRLIHDCFTADEETGEAYCFVRQNGKLIVNGDGLNTVVLKGKVKIVLPLEDK